ncbi:SIR2 family NAD-dependent protein deacylase [Cystobacter fuscus]
MKAGIVRTVVTTNYDDLLERAFAEAGVHVTLQVMDSNFKVIPSHDTARLIKLHGDRSEWKKVILSGHSYKEFSERYAKLEQQLDLLRLQHAFLFVGCSMQDQRILEWLDRLGLDGRKELKPWRPLMLDSEWQDFLKFNFEGRRSIEAIEGANLRPLIGSDHEALLQLWEETATKLGVTVEAVGVSPSASPVLVAAPPAAPPPAKRAHGANRAVWFSEDQSLWNRGHSFEGNQDQKAKFESARGAYMRIIPSDWQGEKPDSLTVDKLNGDLRLQTLGECRYGTSGLNEDGVLFRELGRKGPDEIWRIETATQWFEDNGEIWGVDGRVLVDDEGEMLLAYIYLVRRWRVFLENSLSTLKYLGARGPLLVEAGVAGLKGVRWAGRFNFEKVSALKDIATVEEQLWDWSEAEQLRFVTKAFNEVRRAFGIQKLSESELQQLR